MVYVPNKQSIEHTLHGTKIKWRLQEHLGALGVIGQTAPLNSLAVSRATSFK